RLEQRPRYFVFAKLSWIATNIILNLFWLLFCPWAASNGWDWVYYVWSPGLGVAYIFLANVVASALTLLLLLPQLRKVRASFDPVLWVKMMRYAGPLIIVTFAGVANEMLDRAILTRLLPGTLAENQAQLGIYSANYKLAMLITMFTQAYRYAAEPFFFRHAADKDALKIQANATKWFTIVATAAMLGILLFLDLVKGFIGEKFRGGLFVVPILLVANLLLGIYYNFSVWYRLKDRTLLGAWISVGGAAITVALNLWWVPIIGYAGAAWATLVCYAFMSWMTWYTGSKHHPVPYELGRMGLYVAVALAMFGFSRWAEPLLTAWPLLLWALRVGLFTGFLGLVWGLERENKMVSV
ncbi:MAG: oligosaccharide flippase family protein, partial [Saprospiraceae bacterium]